MLAERMPNFGHRAVAVVCQAFHHDRNTTGCVTLILKLFVGDAIKITGRFFNRALDIILRHIDGIGLFDGQA